MNNCIKRISRVLIIILASGYFLWLFGALVYDGPGLLLTIIAAVVLVAAMACLKFRRNAWIVLGICTVAVHGWWLCLEPPSTADWQTDVSRLATVEIDGDVLTFRNVRDFQYRSETDYESRWIERKVRLSSVTAVDIAINYWGSPWMAHPIVSFQFSDSAPLAFSIETRKRAGQKYSAIGGLYRQYPLVCIVAEERDVLALRGIHRSGEDVYLYRTTMPPDQAQVRLMEYVRTINSLSQHPRWYNAITTNCTSVIRTQGRDNRLPWDWRMLVNGKGDEMMFELGKFETGGLSFEKLKKQAHANAAIKSANGKDDFSTIIRSQTLPK